MVSFCLVPSWNIYPEPSVLTHLCHPHSQGWNNAFAFPWELGMYWNFTTGGVGQRAIGCPGLDEPFGEVSITLCH